MEEEYLSNQNKEEYIICAAVHFDDKLKYYHQPKNIETGIVICGRRHHNCFLTMSMLKVKGSHKDFDDYEQGFLTSKDRFLNRKEAGELAFKANQTDKLCEILFSEDLY